MKVKNSFLAKWFFLAFVFVAIGCSNLVKVDIEKRSVKIEIQNVDRQIMPTSFLEAAFESASFKITGTCKADSSNNFYDDDITSYSALLAKTFLLEDGKWDFTLEMIEGGKSVAKAEIKDMEISIKTSKIYFVFDGYNTSSLDYEKGKGALSVSLEFPTSSNITKVTAGIYETISSSDSIGDLEVFESKNFDSDGKKSIVTFSRDSVSAGAYYVIFKIYQGEKVISFCPEFVYVADGTMSEGVLEVDNTNEVFTIEYIRNGLSFAKGFVAPASYTKKQKVTLPVASNFTKSDAFEGWYEASDFSGDVITGWNHDEKTGNIVLYAKTNISMDWSYPTSTPIVTWDGSGTEESPYIISIPQELADLSYMVNDYGDSYSGTYFKFANDIDLNIGTTVSSSSSTAKQWTPIGSGSSYCFAGTFDGDGYTINGLYINSSSYQYAGLFGYVSGGTIKNVVLGTGYVSNTYSSTSYTGGIAGYLTDGGKIDACGNEGTDIVDSDDAYTSYAGGIVGYDGGSVINSYNKASVTSYSSSSYGRSGGIAGYNYFSIENCYNSGNITGYYAGGIAGYSYGSFYNSYNIGSISGSYAGGIYGYKNGSTSLDYCYYNSGKTSYYYGSGTATTNGVALFSSASSIISSGYTSATFTGGTLLDCLNAWVADQSDSADYYAWIEDDDGWPYLAPQEDLTSYTVTYVLDDGENDSSNPDSVTIISNVTLADPTKSGYVFMGWYSDSDFKSKVTQISKPTADITLYASWMSQSEYDMKYWSYPASTPTTKWTGSGTESDPYVIFTSQDLADLAYLVNNGTSYSGEYFKLGADIDLNYGTTVSSSTTDANQWTPIGSGSYSFADTFDGDGHTINGLYINSSRYENVGLFGNVSGGTIKNVALGTGYVSNTYSSYSYTGGIAGYLASGGKIDACGNLATNISDTDNTISYAGGIVGYDGGSVINSYNKASVTSYRLSSGRSGGIAGKNSSSIENCYNSGDITGYYAGGIAGYSSCGSFYNSYNIGSISGNYAGGIYGDCYSPTYLYYCYYDSTKTSTYCGNDTATTTGVASFSSATSTISGGYTSATFTGGTLLECLNAWVSAQPSTAGYCSWKTGTDGWPVLDFE